MADFTEIIQEINTNLPDNTTQSITAAKLRTTLIDLTNEIDNQQDEFETAAMADIQSAIDIVENGVRFETNQLITETKIVNNLVNGGENDVLSAEMGKRLNDNNSYLEAFTDYTFIEHQAGGIYTYVTNYEIGDYMEQLSDSQSSGWNLRRYVIEPTKYYYGSCTGIPVNMNNVNVYYWADSDKKLISKEKTYGTDEAANTWTDYLLIPPSNAAYLYIQMKSGYSSRYSVKVLESLTAQEIFDKFEEIDTNLDNKADKSDLTIIKTIFPLSRNYKYYNSNAIQNIEENWVNSNNYMFLKYEVKPSTRYYLSGQSSSSNISNVYVYYWADEDGIFISRNQNIISSNQSWGINEEYSLISPSNAKFLYALVPRVLNSTSNYINNLAEYVVKEETQLNSQQDLENYYKDRKEITFLSIGNSYSEDMFSYVPFIMRNINPNIKMTGLMLMQSASSGNPPEGHPISHYINFINGLDSDNNNAKVYWYSRWYPDRLGWKQSGSYNTSIEEALDDDSHNKIDIIFLQAAANSAEANFKWTNALIKKITEYLGYPVQFAVFSCPFRAGLGSSLNQNSRTYDDILYNALGNLEWAKRFMNSTPAKFLVSGCAAIQNARTIPQLQETGSYMNQTNNTSGKGWLSSIDGNHISDGIGRQTNAYAVIGALLQNMGLDWQGIFADTTVMDSNTVRWINTPHNHPSTGTIDVEGTNSENIKLAQFCASMAITHPTSVYNLENYNTDIDISDSENWNTETMEFKKYIRIETNFRSEISSSNNLYYVTEGDNYETTLSGSFNSIQVLMGNLDITKLVYDNETKTISIPNVSDTIKIIIQ